MRSMHFSILYSYSLIRLDHYSLKVSGKAFSTLNSLSMFRFFFLPLLLIPLDRTHPHLTPFSKHPSFASLAFCIIHDPYRYGYTVRVVHAVNTPYSVPFGFRTATGAAQWPGVKSPRSVICFHGPCVLRSGCGTRHQTVAYFRTGHC